ncbi:MAG: homoserine kinase [Chloroflexota bacterium]
MTRARIDVPATSANLGPGFDCLGVAMDLCDTIHVDLDALETDVVLAGLSVDDVAIDERENLLCQAYRSWQEDTGVALPGARFTVEKRIPMGRGLGSSAAAIVGGLAAAAFAAGDKNPTHRILKLATRIEGHPDNVTPATMGGVTVSFCDEGEVHAIHVANHLAIGVAIFVPEQSLATATTRAALPTTIPMSSAVFNLGRLAYLVTALQWGRWDQIGPAMQDRLHQPHRARLIPALNEVIGAALEGGAYGAALSGAGPAVVALAPMSQAEQVAHSMETRARKHAWPGKSITTSVRRWGAVARAVEDT